MYLIEVIPISRSVNKETLSYFSSERISPGSLVAVPLRKKTVNALVVSSTDAREAKTEIRSSEYVMKKVGRFKSGSFLSEAFMKAAGAAAEFQASSLGGILNLLVPKAVLEDFIPVSAGGKFSPRDAAGFDRIAIQADDDERFANYRALIREEFARKRSVFFCLPTAEDVRRASLILQKGIEDYSYAFYGSMPKKRLQKLWKAAVALNHPLLVVATGLFLSIGRSDFGTVVIENESSRFYKLPARPFPDIRNFAEFFARESGIKLLVGDTLLRTETIYRLKQGEFAEFAPPKFRFLSPASHKIVDMRPYRKSAGGKFETMSSDLSELIQKSHKQNRNLFIFAVRRGLSSQTVCGDCGAVVCCKRCLAPSVLHRGAAETAGRNFFFCHRCGEKRSAEERCVVCRSWKLQPLGIGIELVEQELRRKFPKVKVFRIDKDATSTAARAEKESASFYSSPGSVLIGTEMALAHLHRKVDNTAVVSLDSLFSLPDFRVHEKIIHLLLKIRDLTVSEFLVQTRVPDEHVLEQALKGNLIDFYREEIAAREMFRYPPFTTLIKLSLAGTRPAVVREMEKLGEFLKPFEVETFPAFTEGSKSMFTMHALLRLPRGFWVNQELLKRLLSLPPQFRIEVEPESLL